MRYGVLIPCRENQATMLLSSLNSLNAQTIRPSIVVVVDDGSSFNVKSITDWFSFVKYIKFPKKHKEYWTGKPEFAYVHNHGLREIYTWEMIHNIELDYVMILNADTYLEHSYVEKVVGKMDKGTVIASGYIVGEPIPRNPRGSGRIYDWHWFKLHIKQFPKIYSWESYPIYKALAQGYKVKVFIDAKMYTRRKTHSYEANYGYAMRELGYELWYALAKSIYMFSKCSPKTGLKMLLTYLTSTYGVYDEEVAKWIRKYQYNRLKNFLKKLIP